MNELKALMLTHHTYFNLDAYRNPDTVKIWNHTLYLPYSKRYLVADDGALPTGKIGTAELMAHCTHSYFARVDLGGVIFRPYSSYE